MITLNLLDRKRKRDYLYHRVMVTLQKTIEMFFFFVLMMGIIFSLAQYYLQKNFETVAEQIASANRSLETFNESVRGVNYQLKEMTDIQKKYLSWTPVLIDITNAIPNDVNLDSLNIDKDKSLIKISGLAKSRDQFLAMKSNLEKLYFIKDIQSPLTNLLKKNNIKFDFVITIDLSRFTYE